MKLGFVSSLQVIINVGLMNKVLSFDEVISNLIFKTAAAPLSFLFKSVSCYIVQQILLDTEKILPKE